MSSLVCPGSGHQARHRDKGACLPGCDCPEKMVSSGKAAGLPYPPQQAASEPSAAQQHHPLRHAEVGGALRALLPARATLAILPAATPAAGPARQPSPRSEAACWLPLQARRPQQAARLPRLLLRRLLHQGPPSRHPRCCHLLKSPLGRPRGCQTGWPWQTPSPAAALAGLLTPAAAAAAQAVAAGGMLLVRLGLRYCCQQLCPDALLLQGLPARAAPGPSSRSCHALAAAARLLRGGPAAAAAAVPAAAAAPAAPAVQMRRWPARCWRGLPRPAPPRQASPLPPPGVPAAMLPPQQAPCPALDQPAHHSQRVLCRPTSRWQHHRRLHPRPHSAPP